MIIIINLNNGFEKVVTTSFLLIFVFITNLLANEVNIFSARHYDSDVQLYEKFTAKTGIKVNVDW